MTYPVMKPFTLGGQQAYIHSGGADGIWGYTVT